MLRYAGYIDESANLYEVPRPPRRGSHRPAAVAAPVFARAGALSAPADLDATAPLIRSPAARYSLLGKRAHGSVPAFTKVASMRDATASCVFRGLSPPDLPSDPFQDTIVFGDTNAFARSVSAPFGTNSPLQPIHISTPMYSMKAGDLRAPEPLWASQQHAEHLSNIGRYSSRSSSSSGSSGRPSPRSRSSRSMIESYARTLPLSAACQSTQKRCTFAGCTKISVSRGLCRGHGGGRRCQFTACTKSAQSRSNFCWAHGGGKRCEAPGCMRSRKTKRFCVAHIELEHAELLRPDGAVQAAPVAAERRLFLPSLGQALRSASRSPPNLPGTFRAASTCIV